MDKPGEALRIWRHHNDHPARYQALMDEPETLWMMARDLAKHLEEALNRKN